MKKLYSAEDERGGGDWAFKLVYDYAPTIAQAAREKDVTVELDLTTFFVAGKKYTLEGGIPERSEVDYAATLRVTVPKGTSLVDTRKRLYVALRRYLNTVAADIRQP